LIFTPAAAVKARLPRRSAVPAVALAVVALAGCGSSTKSSSSSTPATAAETPAATSSAPASTASTPASTPSASSTLSLEADPSGQLKYTATSLTAKAGTVKIDFTNKSEIAHNVTIEGSGGANVGATESFSGGSKSLSVTLKPGKYKFFCSVPGHRQAGMEGTLTVQ
jgi:plastocyanin